MKKQKCSSTYTKKEKIAKRCLFFSLFGFSFVSIVSSIIALIGLKDTQVESPVLCAELQSSSLSSSGFNVQLFLFITMIIIIVLFGLATIGAVAFLVYLKWKRKQKIVIHYDEGKEETFKNQLTHDNERTNS